MPVYRRAPSQDTERPSSPFVAGFLYVSSSPFSCAWLWPSRLTGSYPCFPRCCTVGDAGRRGAEHRPQEGQLGPQERRGEKAGEAQSEDTARDRRDHPRAHGRGTHRTRSALPCCYGVLPCSICTTSKRERVGLCCGVVGLVVCSCMKKTSALLGEMLCAVFLLSFPQAADVLWLKQENRSYKLFQ